MNIFSEFLAEYGVEILYAVITAIAGYIGIAVKNIYKKYVNDSTKKEVVKTCVNAVEQLYKDLGGEAKYYRAVDAIYDILSQKGISITELEMEMLIEAAVNEFKKNVKE